MTDHDDLIAELRDPNSVRFHPRAADAIKALVAERDAARADIRHVIAERDRTFALVVGQRDEARRRYNDLDLCREGQAPCEWALRLITDRDEARALLREAAPLFYSAHYDGYLDTNETRQAFDLAKRIDALLADKEGTT
jgi:hypothetical protein